MGMLTYFRKMFYLALHCTVVPFLPFAEILMAEMAEAGFEMFEETDTGFIAYTKVEALDDMYLASLNRIEKKENYQAVFSYEIIESKNWNEEWEKNFEPVYAGNVYVRAPFHPPNLNTKYDVIIEPKMAFGTGHHATTSLMIEQMQELDFKSKTVADMGCGTGILAIVAGKMGAEKITAIDIDENCVTNTFENCAINLITNAEIKKGNANDLFNCGRFDIILANINRNIILQDLKIYAAGLAPCGKLLLSGFYTHDAGAITQEANKQKLRYVNQKEKDGWCVVQFISE